jgi:hypothetical protein
LNGFVFVRLFRQIGFAKDTVFIFVLQAATLLGTLVARRTMEYACPFAVLSSGLLLRDAIDSGVLDRWAKAKLVAIQRAAAVAAAAILLVSGLLNIGILRKAINPEFSGFAEWAAITLPDGTAVSNLAWRDFPMLFYAAPQYRYTMGLDPMFGYAYAPERTEALERFRTGQLPLTPRELSELTGARFAFLSRALAPLAKLMIENGFVIRYRGTDGWVFDLRPEP